MGKNKLVNENKMKIEVNSKMKRKLKNAKNKIKVNKNNVFSVFNYLKKNYKSNNIFLYVILKENIIEDNLKQIKYKILNIPNSLISEENKILNIENDNNKNNINIKNIKFIETISLDKFKEKINLFNNEKKSLKNFNNFYPFIFCAQKFNLYLKEIKKSNDIFFYKNENIINEYLNKIILGGTLIKQINKKIFRIKIGNSNMNIENIYENFNKIFYKIICYLLSISQKYNNIEGIVLKTNESIPFKLFGEINLDNLNYFN